VVGLLIAGSVGAAVVLYGADRAAKARARARRRREMSDRLAAATARADEQQEQRQAAEQASAALTSVMPAINRPPLTGPRTGPDRDGG
jgi:gas vesicle protein